MLTTMSLTNEYRDLYITGGILGVEQNAFVIEHLAPLYNAIIARFEIACGSQIFKALMYSIGMFDERD